MTGDKLTDREQLVLEAVIRTYVDTAEPVGSRTIARRFDLGVSSATVRNTMSDLEENGYLFHPHTSAGRVPTDRAYRLYVDTLLGQPRRKSIEQKSIRRELKAAGERSAVELLIRHAAQVLGLLTQELGIAMAPRLEQIILERLELVSIADGKVLLVLTLRAAGVRTIFVDVPADVPPASVATVAQLLNERLAGHTLSEIRRTLPERLRDAGAGQEPGANELLNLFIDSAENWFEWPTGEEPLHLGRASVLADQPEFNTGPGLRSLIELTERTDLLRAILGERLGVEGLQVTIGAEHTDPALTDYTVVTSEYRVGGQRGVIGVIGPTRMPYERVIGLVESTSVLVSEFLT